MEKGFCQRLKLRLILFLARRIPPCNVLLPVFSEERERPLTTREKVTKKLHLLTCQACRRYVAQIAQMSEMVKPLDQTETIPPTAKLSDEARRRIRTALVAAAQSKPK